MDPIFAVMKAHAEDPRSRKVNLGIGIYRDREGLPFVFESVQKAASSLSFKNFEYNSMQGNTKFLEETVLWLLGKDFIETSAIQQSLGGTHALRLISDFVQVNNPNPKLLIGTPTWSNHFEVFEGFEIVKFAHLESAQVFNTKACLEVIDQNPKSFLILHGGVTHNPTGINLKIEDLKKIVEMANAQGVFVIIDAAYIGFGDGVDKDIEWIKTAFEGFDQCALSVSFSKNASLYNQRLGVLLWKCENFETKKTLESHLQAQVRATISNLPAFGASVMEKVFTQDRDSWLAELEKARLDVNQRQEKLIELLPENFNFLNKTKGLFGMSGLNTKEVEFLKTEFGIYMPPNGRINFAGIRDRDFEILEKAFQQI